MVERGDNLSQIARAAYGRPSAYQTIFDFNPGKLRDPSSLPVGVELFIPCLDGTATALPTLPTAERERPEIRIVTGSEYPPYVDAGLPEGGFSVEVVERALLYDGSPKDYRIDVIADWAALLTPLLEDGAYDLTFPWFKPDCSQRDKLGEASLWRCDNLIFSETLHEVVITFYVKIDAEGVGSLEEIRDGNRRICRPRGYFTFDLEIMGVISLWVAGDSPTDCFERLIAGEVDVVSVNAETADRVITEQAIGWQVRELTLLASVQTLHVVAYRGDENARIVILRVNRGILGLREDGTFREIARRHLLQ